MIILTNIAVIASLARFSYFTTPTLIARIIIIRCSISLIIFWKFSSILSLLWIIVYLGGMMVCFVYILFITYPTTPQLDGHQNNAWGGVKGRRFLPISSIILALKGLSTRLVGVYNWELSVVNIRTMVQTESYSQIVSQAPFFFILLAIIALYSSLQVIRILRLKSKRISTSLL